MEKINYDIENISSVATEIISKSKSNILCMSGDLGAGKTTLIKQILIKIGVVEIGSSPTFNLINHYHDHKGQLLAYHIDCYRLESVEEALDIGIEDYLNANCYVFIEWPERIKAILPKERTEIYIRTIGDYTRELGIENIQ